MTRVDEYTWWSLFRNVAGYLAFLILFASLLSSAYAQTPNPVTPGYKVCSTVSGSTKCGWAAVAGSQASTSISTAAASTITLISGKPGLATYITSLGLQAAGSTGVRLLAGTGTNCGTNTVNLTGSYTLSATTPPLVLGSGNGAVLIAPVGYDVCMSNSAAVQTSGSVSYSQF